MTSTADSGSAASDDGSHEGGRADAPEPGEPEVAPAAPAEPTGVEVDTGPHPVVTPPAGIRLPEPLPVPPGGPEAGPANVVLAPPPVRSRPRRAGQRHGPSRPASRRVVKERLRHVDPWSVFKISAIFYTCLATVLLVGGTILWQFARSAGTVDDIESFITELFTYGDCVPEDELELGQEAVEHENCPEGQLMVGSFEISGPTLFRSAFLGGALFVVIATVGTVFVVLLFNLLSDMIGGVRYSVVREPLDTATRSTRSGSER